MNCRSTTAVGQQFRKRHLGPYIASPLTPLAVAIVAGAVAERSIERHSYHISVRRGYQVPFARRIREEADIWTGAVGSITEVRHADELVTCGDTDLIFFGRELLREPY